MSYVVAMKSLEQAVVNAGLGLHYESVETMTDLSTSVASDFDGTFLFTNTGGGDKLKGLQTSDADEKEITVQVASLVGASRLSTEVLAEQRGQAVISAIKGAASNSIYSDVKEVQLTSAPSQVNVASSVKIVWSCSFRLVYSTIPSPIVYFDCEAEAHGDGSIESVALGGVSKTGTLAGGAIVSNVSPLSGLNSLPMDGVNDWLEIPADHDDLLDFKLNHPWTIFFEFRHDGTAGTEFLFERNYTAGDYIYVSWLSGNKLGVNIALNSGGSYNKYYEVAGDAGASPISLVDGAKHAIAIEYDGSGSAEGIRAVADGVEMTLESSSYTAGDPVFADIEYLGGAELESAIRYRFGGSPAGFRGVATFDKIAFFLETLSNDRHAQLAAGTSPLELT